VGDDRRIFAIRLLADRHRGVAGRGMLQQMTLTLIEIGQKIVDPR